MPESAHVGSLVRPNGVRNIFDHAGWVAVLGCLFFGSCIAACGQALADEGSGAVELHIDSVHPDASSTVSFTVTYVDSYPYSTLPEELLDVNLADTYRAAIDLQSMATVKGRFSFRVYVNRSDKFEKSIYAYEVAEDTTDTFNDIEKPVNFRIGPEQKSVSGEATVPMHSPFGPPTALAYKDKDGKVGTPPLQDVSIGENKPFPLILENQLSNLKATLGVPLIKPDCRDCWSTVPTATVQSSMNPGDSITVSFSVTSDSFRAMQASATQIGPDKSNDILRVSIPVTPEGGTMRMQVFAVPVRFTPPLWEMVVTVLLGACLGGALRRYFAPGLVSTDGSANGNRKTSGSTKDFFTGVVLALLCEAVAYALCAETSTEVKLIGVSLDPRQPPTAFLLCVLIGGGTAVVNAIRSALGL